MTKGNQLTPTPSKPAEPVHSPSTVPAVDAKLHYDELRLFHEKLVSEQRVFHERIAYVILAVLGLAGALLYSNMRDVKDAVERTEATAKKQIENVKAEAENTAREEARKRVDEAFKQNNLQSLIDETAKKEVGAGVQRRIREEFEYHNAKLREDMTAVSRVFGLIAQMRGGRWKAGRELIAAAKSEPNEMARRLASEELARISVEFDAYVNNADPWPTDAATKNKYYRNIANVPETATDNEVHTAYLKLIVYPYAQTMEISTMFFALRKLTGRDFRMFDLDALKRWAVEVGVANDIIKALDQP